MNVNRTNSAFRAGVRAARPAFSLLELMLVVAIIGILMAVVAFNLVGQAARAKVGATKISMRTIKGALVQYNVEYNGFPPALQTLVAVKMLADDKQVKDGWGNDFYYSPAPVNDKPYQLISLGEDLQPGTADDIDAATIDNATPTGK